MQTISNCCETSSKVADVRRGVKKNCEKAASLTETIGPIFPIIEFFLKTNGKKLAERGGNPPPYGRYPSLIHILQPLDVLFHMAPAPPNIWHTYSKNWRRPDSATLVNSDFEGPKSRLHSKICGFQSLSDFSNLYEWHHIVCHRYA